MKVKREGREGSLVSLGERGWELQMNYKNSKVKLFARKFRPIYCKYLHKE